MRNGMQLKMSWDIGCIAIGTDINIRYGSFFFVDTFVGAHNPEKWNKTMP